MLGVYGGTFDPVHFGHLRTALEVKELFNLDEVRLIPCFQPPHRDQPEVSAQQRLTMLQLAVANEPKLRIDNRELQRQGPSYMVDTLASLRAEVAEAPLCLFIGSDAFQHLSTWRRWQQLFDYAHVIVMNRPASISRVDALDEFLKSVVETSIATLQARPHGCLFFQNVTQLDISATQIRRALIANRNPRFLLPDAVLEYIYQQKLYTMVG